MDGQKDQITELCQRLKEEALEPARAEADRVIVEAKKRAQRIIEEAQRQAHDYRVQEKEQLQRYKASADSGIQQALTRAESKIKQDFEQFIRKVIEGVMSDALGNEDLLVALVEAMVESTKAKHRADTLQLSIAKKFNPEKIAKLLSPYILSHLEDGIVLPDNQTRGISIHVVGGAISYEITPEYLYDAMAPFLPSMFRSWLER